MNSDLKNLFGINLDQKSLSECNKIDAFINSQTNTIKNKLNQSIMNIPINVNTENVQFSVNNVSFSELKLNPSMSYSCSTQIIVSGTFIINLNVNILNIPEFTANFNNVMMSVFGNIVLTMLPTTNLSIIPDITNVVISNLVFSANNSSNNSLLMNVIQTINTNNTIYNQLMFTTISNYLKTNLIKAVAPTNIPMMSSSLMSSSSMSSSLMSSSMSTPSMSTPSQMNMSNDWTNMMNSNQLQQNTQVNGYNEPYYGSKKHYDYDSDSDSYDWDPVYGYYRSGNRRHKKLYYDRQLLRPKHKYGYYRHHHYHH